VVKCLPRKLKDLNSNLGATRKETKNFAHHGLSIITKHLGTDETFFQIS
jgi:hypothetical protein